MKKVSKLLSLAVLVLFVVFAASCKKTYKGSVSFTSPANNATVTSPVHVQMNITGMTVQAAGKIVEGTGHHHIIIDGGNIPEGSIVPKDDHHRHFGKGQTEADLVLSEGKHSLTLQFADGIHQSYGKAWSKTIDITVKKAE